MPRPGCLPTTCKENPGSSEGKGPHNSGQHHRTPGPPRTDTGLDPVLQVSSRTFLGWSLPSLDLHFFKYKRHKAGLALSCAEEAVGLSPHHMVGREQTHHSDHLAAESVQPLTRALRAEPQNGLQAQTCDFSKSPSLASSPPPPSPHHSALPPSAWQLLCNQVAPAGAFIGTASPWAKGELSELSGL